MGIPAACTVRSNRMDRCPLKSEKELMREGRGSMDYRLSNDGILVIKWYDNKEVTVASNHYGASPVAQVKRWDKKKKVFIHIPCPAIISAYNKGMGGVDRCDQLLAFYRMKNKTPKWYKRILLHFTDLALINAFILRKAQQNSPTLPLYEFKLAVATALMHADNFSEPLSRAAVLLRDQGLVDAGRAGNGDPVGWPDPSDASRLDGSNHWPAFVANRPRTCRLRGCKQRSTVWCSKCRVYLCVKSKQNCFVLYHTEH